MGNIFTKWLENYFDEVEPLEFYRDLWPDGELENAGEMVTGKYTGIAIELSGERWQDNNEVKIRRYNITNDLKAIREMCKTDNFCLTAPLSYAGKQRTAKNARFMYAMAIDLDHIQTRGEWPSGLDSLWNGHIANGRIPKPTYIVSSGTGLHLYYFLKEPMPLYPNLCGELQKLKRQLTETIWHGTIVDITNEWEIQQEGIYQGFRIIGTITKNGDRTRAFLTGPKWTIEELGGYVPEVFKLSHWEKTKGTTPMEQAKQKWPEWYERRIVNKMPRKAWATSRNVYQWWKRQILEKGRVGHRYWCLMMLSIYAYKCSFYDEKHNPNPVTYEELRKDAQEIASYFESLTNDENNHFTGDDVAAALDAFDRGWVKYPIQAIEYRSGFSIKRNKRNGRTQAEHLAIARAILALDYKNGKLRISPGRPTKQKEVEEWQRFHPGARKADCIRETGMSKPTVYKYWKP